MRIVRRGLLLAGIAASVMAMPTIMTVPSTAALAASASQAAAPVGPVQRLDNALTETMQNAVQLKFQGRYDKLAPVLNAVFDVPAQVIRTAPPDAAITVTLADDPQVQAHGRVREVAPQADPVTRTFQVRVGLDDPPASMRLGSTVVGRMVVDAGTIIDIPSTALTQHDQRPAVWVVDPTTSTVSMRQIDVLRYDPSSVVVSSGLSPGDVVVTAGVQALHPGQKVRLLGSPSAAAVEADRPS